MPRFLVTSKSIVPGSKPVWVEGVLTREPGDMVLFALTPVQPGATADCDDSEAYGECCDGAMTLGTFDETFSGSLEVGKKYDLSFTEVEPA